MVEEKKEEKKEEVKFKWVVTDIPDTFKPAIVDTEKKEAYTVETALAKILNDLEELKKLL